MKKTRNGMLDVWRFVFCLLLGMHHLYHIFVPEPYPFKEAWVYVEFYFIVTGYFTAAHFSKIDSAENVVEDTISYTYKKFKNLFPYVFIAVTFQYIIECFATKMINSFLSFMVILPNYLSEIFLITVTRYHSDHLGPIWFLSAMFVTFPIICLLLRSPKTKKIYMVYLSWLLPFIYYGRFGVTGAGICGNMEWPHQMVRAICCMSFGVFVYQITKVIGSIEFNKKLEIPVKLVFTFFEFACFLSTIYMTGKNMDYSKVVLSLIVLGLICNLSGYSYSSYISGSIFSFIGKLSLTFYLIHIPVGTFIDYYIPIEDIKRRVIVFFALSLLAALLVEGVVYGGRYLIKKKKEKSLE